MKIKKILAAITAMAMSVATVPTVSVAAYENWGNYYTHTVQVDFLILGYSEKNGELTITGCYDYDPLFRCNGGYIAVCLFDGVLSVPSHIDGKPVIGIKNLSGTDSIHKLIIPETVTNISETAYSGCNLITEYTEKELKLITLYCYNK